MAVRGRGCLRTGASPGTAGSQAGGDKSRENVRLKAPSSCRTHTHHPRVKSPNSTREKHPGHGDQSRQSSEGLGGRHPTRTAARPRGCWPQSQARLAAQHRAAPHREAEAAGDTEVPRTSPGGRDSGDATLTRGWRPPPSTGPTVDTRETETCGQSWPREGADYGPEKPQCELSRGAQNPLLSPALSPGVNGVPGDKDKKHSWESMTSLQ